MRTTALSLKLGYGDVQARYTDAGWTPLPLPRGRKFPPPKGYTGEGHAVPTAEIYTYWAHDHADGNVALVMLEDVIGIDVDIYGDKHGGETFQQLLKRYGSLPSAPFSTNRVITERGIHGGIHFYRVPAGLKFVRGVGSGIDIIQAAHRYAVTYPSIHPEGRQYRWYAADGTLSGIPSIDDLPELPEQWVNGLSAASKARAGHGFPGSVDEWMAQLDEGRPPLAVRRRMAEVQREFRYCGGRYDTMVATVAKLVGWGAAGFPVEQAIVELLQAYESAVGDERDAYSEFTRALEGAINKFGAK